MTKECSDSEQAFLKRMVVEERIRNKIDERGTRWTKVYFGGGAHFQNWLIQIIELKGVANVKVEEVDPSGFHCYEESGEKMYRIWTRDEVR